MADEMKNCPFCGLDVNEDEGCFPVRMDRSVWEVRCGNPYCFGHSPDAPTREAAIAKWNRRALSHAAGQDGEQCRAASGYAGRLASKLEDVREGIADVLPIVYLETIDDAIEALRALSRGVPEGMVLVPVEPTSEMETAHRMYGDTSDWWQTVITAAIAAQRKEGE